MAASLLGAAGASASGSSGARRHCGPAGAHTVMSNGFGRVYNRRGSVYACAFSGGKSHRLGRKYDCSSSSDCGGVNVVRLAGEWVAVAQFLEQQDTTASL